MRRINVLSKSRKLEKEAHQHRGASKRQFIRSTVNEPLFDAEEWSAESGRIRYSTWKAWRTAGLRLCQSGEGGRTVAFNPRIYSNIPFRISWKSCLSIRRRQHLFTYDTGEIVLLFPHYSELHVNNSQKVEQTLRQLQSCLQQYAKMSFSFITGSSSQRCPDL